MESYSLASEQKRFLRCLDSRWFAYLMAFAAPLLTVWFCLMAGLAGGDSTVMNIFIIPVLLCAYSGGLGPGLVCILWSVLLSDYFLLPPLHTFLIDRPIDRVHELTFLATAVVMSAMIEALRRARKKARTTTEEGAYLQKELSRISLVSPAVFISYRLLPDGTSNFPYIGGRIKEYFDFDPMNGVDPEKIFSLIHQEDRDNVRRSITESARNMLAWQKEFRIHHPRFGERWVEGKATVERDPDGSILWSGYITDCTEKKRFESALHDSEERYSIIFNTIQDAIFLHTPDGKVVDLNHAAELMYGVEREEALGMNILKDFSTSDNPLEQAPILWNRALQGEQVHFFWNTRRPKDGSGFFAEVWLLHISLGRQSLILANVQDATEQRQTEKKLIESEQRYREIFNSSGDAMFIYDEGGTILDVNQRTCDLFGYTREELLTCSSEQLCMDVPSYTASASMAYLNRALEEGFCTFEWQTKCKDGTIVWSEVAMRATEIDGKKRVIAAGRDITERKKREEELTRSQEFLRESQRVAHIGCWDYDFKTRRFQWNEELYKILGLQDKEIEPTYQRLFEFVHPDDCKFVREQLENALKEKVYKDYEYRVIRRDGSVRILYIAGAFILDAAGEPLRNIGIAQDITDRKASEAALHQRDAQLQSVFRAAPVGIALTVNRIIQECNDALLNIIGYTREEIIGKSPRMIYPTQEEYESVGREQIKKMRSGETGFVETRWQRKDGVIRHILLRFVPLVSSDHSNGVTFSALDITELKEIEEILRKSEERFSKTFHSSPGPMVVSELATGLCIDANAKMMDMLGLMPEEMIGRTSFELGIWDDPNDREKLSTTLQKNGCVKGMEIKLRNKKGELKDTLWSAEVITLGGRDVMLSLIYDNTDRKRAEEALREREIFLRRSQEVGRVGSYILGIAGEKSSEQTWQCTPVMDEIFGIDEEYPKTGEHWLKLIVQREDIERYFSEVVFGEHKKFEREYQIVRPKDGEQRWIFGYGEVEYDGRGNPLRMIGTVQDITERKIAEEEIKKLNEELEQRVVERTAQLEIANKELESFAYSVSHDLRAPLRAIDGYTRILREDYEPSLDAEGKRVCAIICDESQRMGHLIDDLLAFSRISRSSMKAVDVDMSLLVKETLQDVLTSDARERIDLREHRLAHGTGDPVLLRQVWTNLIANAVKFSSKKEKPLIEIRSVREGDTIVYSVHDNGAGFDMQYAAKLFGVFQRLHSMQEYEGTGVGLAIVHRIIGRHGGHVWAEGAVDKGATFYFSLPNKGGTYDGE
jgi:PAS domain S-box-containing protein